MPEFNLPFGAIFKNDGINAIMETVESRFGEFRLKVATEIKT